MKFTDLVNTPIKEIVFSVSYDKIVDPKCFDKFVNLESIKTQFSEIKPSIDQQLEFKDERVSVTSNPNGFHLKGENEIIQIRKGSFSFHHLNGYRKFDELLSFFTEIWKSFDEVTAENLKVTEYSVRYINLIDLEEKEQISRVVQLYPKYSSDRKINTFQNSINFCYDDFPETSINISSTKLKTDSILLDISANGLIPNSEKTYNLTNLFIPLQNLKNRAFFDSITARTLLKYL